ncbi:MAG: hypothetical protein SPG82_07710, partial [Escherichia coli]|nr:hypothetical protein [Escherichia coli]
GKIHREASAYEVSIPPFLHGHFMDHYNQLNDECCEAIGNRMQGVVRRNGLMAFRIMMVLTVMFFVFSCVLSLTPADLAAAKEQNISILSYLANHFNAPVIAWMAPIIAIIAITKSFLGHYLGAREGFNGMVIKSLRGKGKSIEINKLNRITALFMLVTTWIVATLNPSILGMIETLGGPIIAMILFLMPMYAIQKVPAMRKYSGHISNVFVVVMGLIAISAIFYSLFS